MYVHMFIEVNNTMETTRVLSHIFAGMEDMCITYYLCMYDHICGLYVSHIHKHNKVTGHDERSYVSHTETMK